MKKHPPRLEDFISVRRVRSDYVGYIATMYILIRPLSLSPGNGKCKLCGVNILKGEKMHLTLMKGSRYPCKLCVSCAPPPTPEMSADEMRGMRDTIKKDWAQQLQQLQKLSTPQQQEKKFGFYGKTCSDGTKFRQRHPFSNFHLEPVTAAGHVFRCSEGVIMFCKALRFKDGQVAHALASGAHSGTVCKQLGRMVQGFVARKWKPKGIAMYVVLLKRQQCPVFRKELARVGKAQIYECSKTDYIWGTGTSLDEFPYAGTGTNYLGRALTVASLM